MHMSKIHMMISVQKYASFSKSTVTSPEAYE